MTDLGERFMAKVKISESNDCWNWDAYVDPDGYGRFVLNGRTFRAHRASYVLFIGPIPDGLEIDHLCRNRGCVNPSHIEAVSRRTNWLRSQSPSAINLSKTHCINGHAFDTANTRTGRNGMRYCRRCNADAAARYHARKKGK